MPYTSKVNHMAIRSFSHEAYVYRAPLKESWDLLVHECYFSLETNFDRLSRLYVLVVFS